MTIWEQKVKTKIKILWGQMKGLCLCSGITLEAVADTGQDCARKLWTIQPCQWTLAQFFAVVLFHWAVTVESQRFHHKPWGETLGQGLHSGLVMALLLMSSSVVGLRFKNPCDTILEISLFPHLVGSLGQTIPCYPAHGPLCLPSSPSLLFVFVQQGWFYFPGIAAEGLENLSTCCALKCTWNPSCSYSLGSGS